MGRTFFTVLALLACVGSPVRSAAQAEHPAVYIDRDVCPGEGCDYGGRIKVLKRTPAYSRPDATGAAVREFVAGDLVTASESEVHTTAGRFTAKRAFDKYRAGDVLWAYTYLGEGVFKVWHGGRMYEDRLDFSPWGGTAGKRCEKDAECWGELEEELEMKWWAKVKSVDGREGWVEVAVGENLEWAGKY